MGAKSQVTSVTKIYSTTENALESMWWANNVRPHESIVVLLSKAKLSHWVIAISLHLHVPTVVSTIVRLTWNPWVRVGTPTLASRYPIRITPSGAHGIFSNSASKSTSTEDSDKISPYVKAFVW